MKTNENLHTSRGMFRIVITLAVCSALATACERTQSAEQQLDDSKVTAAIASKYALDTEIDRYTIDIDTANGTVTLRGTVANAEQRTEAERIAKGTEGVREVVNELEIDPTPRTAGTAFEDAWIASMINSKLMVDPEVRSRNIDIDVREGVVTLSGTVETKAARAEAEDLAKSVDGVVSVVNEINVGG
jgi:hyperosmotically inducible protein